MVEPDTSPLDSAAATVGEQASEAFELLSNDIRLAILLTLWDATEVGPEDDALSFTTLRDRVGVPQGGQFNYHLDKLVGQFIERTEDGYALRRTGENVIRTVIGGAGFDAPTLDQAEIELPCRHCGGQTALTYEDEWLYRVCTECPGTFETESVPDGCLSGYPLDPAAITNRTPEELFAVAKFLAMRNVHSKMEGICTECSGPTTRQLQVCEDHDATDICDACGRTDPIRAQLTCQVCGHWDIVPVDFCLAFHPEVVGFYYDHGVSIWWEVDDISTLRQIRELIQADIELTATDPPRVRVTFSCDDDILQLTLTDGLTVVDTEQRAVET